MPTDAGRAERIVEGDIVEAGPVAEPDGIAFGAKDFVRKVPAGLKIADPNREELGALRVGGPGDQPVIR